MELSEAIDLVRSSVLQIIVGEADHQRRQVIGTAFLVDENGYALTARHVTEDARSVVSQTPQARLMAGLALPSIDSPQLVLRASFELVGVDVVEEDQRHDIALLRLSPNPFTSGRPSGVHRTAEGGVAINAQYAVAAVDERRPRDGDRVAVSGYPLSEPTLVTTSGGIASAWGTDIKEVQPPGAPDGFTMPDVADSYLADVAVNPGNSGGPVYLISTGMVTGVCVAFRVARAGGTSPFSYNSGLSIVVPIRYGLDLLRKHSGQVAT